MDKADADTAITQTVHHCCSLAHHAKALKPDDIDGHREVVRLLIQTTDVLMAALGVNWEDRRTAMAEVEAKITSLHSELEQNERLTSEAERQLSEATARAEALLERLEATGTLPEAYWQFKAGRTRPH